MPRLKSEVDIKCPYCNSQLEADHDDIECHVCHTTITLHPGGSIKDFKVPPYHFNVTSISLVLSVLLSAGIIIEAAGDPYDDHDLSLLGCVWIGGLFGWLTTAFRMSIKLTYLLTWASAGIAVALFVLNVRNLILHLGIL